MKQVNVLLVEDSPPIQTLVSSLIGQMCNLVCASNLEQAKRELKTLKYSLVILDVMLPDGNGYDFCNKLREEAKYADLPVIFLTSKADVEDKVAGFKSGGDDYLVKPFEPKEFVARIEAKLKRAMPKKDLTAGAFRINTTSQKAFIKGDESVEKDLDLTPIEYKLLANFIRNEGKVLAREEIKTNVWGESVHVSSHTIDTHISSLRKKIEPFGKSIKSIVKQGYIFNLPPNDHTA